MQVSRASTATLTTLAIAFVAVGLMGCSKGKLEASVKGYKPGSSSIVLIHVKGDKGASVSCTESGLPCARTDLGAAGEADIEIDEATAFDKPKVVFLHAQFGRREATTSLSLEGDAGLPPRVEVSSGGLITCISRTCTGLFNVGAASSISLTASPGTSIDVGSQHFVSDAKGAIQTPVNVVTTPAMKDVLLSKLCSTTPSPLGTTKLTLTFADGAKATTDVAMSTAMINSGFGALLTSIKKGPVLFPWEKSAAAPNKAKHSAVYASSIGCTAFGGAADATIGDIAVIVLGETKATRADTCTYVITDETTNQNHGSKTGKLTLNDEEATAYDRATGRKLGDRVFPATKFCDPDIKLKNASTPIKDQSSYASPSAIAAWAATLK